MTLINTLGIGNKCRYTVAHVNSAEAITLLLMGGRPVSLDIDGWPSCITRY